MSTISKETGQEEQPNQSSYLLWRREEIGSIQERVPQPISHVCHGDGRGVMCKAITWERKNSLTSSSYLSHTSQKKKKSQD